MGITPRQLDVLRAYARQSAIGAFRVLGWLTVPD